MSTQSTSPSWFRRFLDWIARPPVVLAFGTVSVVTLAALLVVRFAAPDAVSAFVTGSSVDPRAFALGTGLLAAGGMGAAGQALAARCGSAACSAWSACSGPPPGTSWRWSLPSSADQARGSLK